MSISLIAGLGNPGEEYKNTRHNIGFMVIDALAARLSFSWDHSKSMNASIAGGHYAETPLRLAKPLSYMNLSGSSLAKIARYYKNLSGDTVVIYDDIHLALGTVKISVTGSSGGHNGVEDLLSHFGHNFIRYRIGIGGKAHQEMDLKDHVLGKLTSNEESILASKMSKIVDGIIILVEKGPIMAMNLINQKEKTEQLNEQRQQQSE